MAADKLTQNSREYRKQRSKRMRMATYIGTFGSLFLVGLVGVVLWFINYHANITVYQVGDYQVKKDLYTCVYYCNSVAAEDWSQYGYDATVNAYEQKFTYEVFGKTFDTWGDYFQSLTNDSLEYMLVMEDIAQKQGYEYPASVQEKIDAEMENMLRQKGTAKSFKIFMVESFGAEISKATFLRYITMYYRAADFYAHITKSKALFNRYIDVQDSSYEEIYEENKDQIDVVSFRFYYLNKNKTNAAKIKALKSATSEKEFQKLCNTYAADAQYVEDDSSYYENYALSRINLLAKGEIVTALNSPQAKAGDIIAEDGQQDGKDIVQIVYLVKARGKDTTLRSDSDVQKWEYAAMGVMLEAYYDAHYTVSLSEEGIEAFRQSMLI